MRQPREVAGRIQYVCSFECLQVRICFCLDLDDDRLRVHGTAFHIENTFVKANYSLKTCVCVCVCVCVASLR